MGAYFDSQGRTIKGQFPVLYLKSCNLVSIWIHVIRLTLAVFYMNPCRPSSRTDLVAGADKSKRARPSNLERNGRLGHSILDYGRWSMLTGVPARADLFCCCWPRPVGERPHPFSARGPRTTDTCRSFSRSTNGRYPSRAVTRIYYLRIPMKPATRSDSKSATVSNGQQPVI